MHWSCGRNYRRKQSAKNFCEIKMSKQVPPGWFIPFSLIELFSLQWEFSLIDLTLLFLVKSRNHIFIHSTVVGFFSLSWDMASESVHSSLKDVLRKWGHLGFPSKQFHSSGNPFLLYEPPPNNKVWLSYFHYPFPHHQDVLREVGVGKRWNERLVTLANREYFI